MELLLAHKEGILYGLVGFVVFGWVLAKLPVMLINWCIAKVDAMFAAGDEADDKLLVAFMKWINTKFGPRIPGDNTWPERMNSVVVRLVSLAPVLPLRVFFTVHADKVKELCQKLYDLGIAATVREIEQHDKPAIPPAPPAA